MSYILDALKKSERERNLGAIPDLDTIQGQAANRFNWWPWLVVALVLLNGGLGLAFLMQQPSDQLVSQLPGSGDFPQSPAIVSPPSTVAGRHQAPSLSAWLTESNLRDDGSISVPRRDHLRSESPAPPANVQPTEMQPRSVVGVSAEAQPFVNPPPVHMPVATVSVTKWEDMPADFRARVARPEIDVHAYSSQPERRFVLIDLQKYREGERLGSGVEIETITEKGVIFSDQGTRFEVARP